MFAPDTNSHQDDKQYRDAQEPVEYGLGPIAIDFHNVESRRLGVCHWAGVDVSV